MHRGKRNKKHTKKEGAQEVTEVRNIKHQGKKKIVYKRK
jgi:hypothetical protein